MPCSHGGLAAVRHDRAADMKLSLVIRRLVLLGSGRHHLRPQFHGNSYRSAIASRSSSTRVAAVDPRLGQFASIRSSSATRQADPSRFWRARASLSCVPTLEREGYVRTASTHAPRCAQRPDHSPYAVFPHVSNSHNRDQRVDRYYGRDNTHVEATVVEEKLTVVSGSTCIDGWMPPHTVRSQM